jgi:hypothetical protein
MDIIDRHVAAENAHDVQATVDENAWFDAAEVKRQIARYLDSKGSGTS